MHTDQPSLIETSRICNSVGGLLLISKSIGMAIASARRDVELECKEVKDIDGATWWDSRAGLFTGEDESDREFRQMLDNAIAYLEEFDRIERHAANRHWIRFKGEPA